MTDPAATKKALRTEAMARRDALPPAVRAAAARAVSLALVDLLDRSGRLPARGIAAGYLAMRSELDPLPSMTALAGRGQELCLPAVVARGEPLAFRFWTPETPLDPGPLGTRQPGAGAGTALPDLLLVPMLSFDRMLNRLGYGGGYYDRSLAVLRASRPVFAVGLAFAAQETDSLPVEAWDQRLDAIVTERGVLTAGGPGPPFPSAAGNGRRPAG